MDQFKMNSRAGYPEIRSVKEGGQSFLKRFAACLFSAVIFFAVPVPAGASAAEAPASQPAAVVSLGTLENLLDKYSLDVKAARNALSQARENYRDKKEWEGVTQADRDSMEAAELTYRDSFRHLVLSAKRQYLSYCLDSSLLSADEEASGDAQKQLAADSGLLSRGALSQTAYEESLENYQKLEAAAKEKDARVTQDRKALRALLNLPENTPMDVLKPSDEEMDLSGIPTLNYGEDVLEMKRANASIQKDSMNFATVRKEISSSDRDIENAQIQLTQTENRETSAFRDLYDTLTISFPTYEQEKEQAARREKDVEIESRRLTLGYTSEIKYRKAVSDLRTLECQRETDRNTLYLALLEYQDMKGGISWSGSPT